MQIQIKEVIYSYLRQQAERLLIKPNNLVTRDMEYEHPTNFSSMKESDLELLILRGEQLMTILVNEYCPELVK